MLLQKLISANSWALVLYFVLFTFWWNVGCKILPCGFTLHFPDDWEWSTFTMFNLIYDIFLRNSPSHHLSIFDHTIFLYLKTLFYLNIREAVKENPSTPGSLCCLPRCESDISMNLVSGARAGIKPRDFSTGSGYPMWQFNYCTKCQFPFLCISMKINEMKILILPR